MSNLLREYRDYKSANIVLEESGEVDGVGNKLMCMKGIFIQGDIKNQNQRIYPVKEIANAVRTLSTRINNNETIQGELDHPTELNINLDRVSHFITEMWMEGNNGYGKLKIIPTPMGNIASTLLRYGAKLGVSSRGSGNVNDQGIVTDFDIITVDIVAQPSAPEAYPRVIYESLHNMKGGQQIIEAARYAHTERSAERYLASQVASLIKDLKI